MEEIVCKLFLRGALYSPILPESNDVNGFAQKRHLLLNNRNSVAPLNKESSGMTFEAYSIMVYTVAISILHFHDLYFQEEF